MDFMKPIALDEITPDKEWIYEMKFDGFRACIEWNKEDIKIISRNQTDLTGHFPEIMDYCMSIQSVVHSLLPLRLDGELVVLNNAYQANFNLIQKRGRLKNPQKIAQAAEERPASFVVFDLLILKGESYSGMTLFKRKEQLQLFFSKFEVNRKLQMIPVYHDYEEISKLVFTYKLEGIVAKRKKSTYIPGKKHRDWYKQKNWRTIEAFLTAYDPGNNYFNVAVFEQDEIISIGKCKHGLDEMSQQSLTQLFIQNGELSNHLYTLPPAVCVNIHTLDLHVSELREPEFAAILPNHSPEECTLEKMHLDMAMLPNVDISNVDKIFWPELALSKADLLIFMREISPYMLPYVSNRALTVIRCPDGIEEKNFFQKNLPDYAPDYIEFIDEADKRIQLCNQLDSLIWFANHSAIEYHIPFQTVDQVLPTEIVFDLDPPNREAFTLAVQAALIIKQLLDNLELTSFIKTSGNKGLQIHIPIARHSMSYEETAIFTEAIAHTVVKMEPTLFTIERLKKNRGGKLYIDYVQHGENRTIIAPYSPRKTVEATVATPLFWEEVREDLFPTQFTIQNVVKRVQTLGCPWLPHYEQARNQKLTKLLELIRVE